MNVDPLRKWLKLPNGTWPPDHYTLLGLAPGEGDADTIERRVFERMDLLRRYQLAHPELVTEGMNRLAQAQICLIDPHARQPYDVALLGHAPDLPPTVKIPRQTVTKSPPPVVVEPPPVVPEPPPPVVELPAVVDDLPPGIQVIDYSPELIDSMPEGEPLILSLGEEELFVDDAPEYTVVETTATTEDHRSQMRLISIAESQRYRRDIYRRLAKIRRVLLSWDRLKPYLADPTHQLTRRADTMAVTTWLTQLKTTLEELSDWPDSPIVHESLVATIARQPLAVQMIREMLAGQRQALADDWHRGRKALLQSRARLRDEVNMLCQKPWSHRIGRPIIRQLQKRPEYILVAVGGYALLVAYMRSRGTP